MIPKILHQIVVTADVPDRFSGCMRSWQTHNPGWERILWTDRTLLDFVAEHYPDFLPIYCSYPNGVMRADAGRYMLLHHFGGVYADIDCECVSPFDGLAGEDRIVMCREPLSHWQVQGAWRGMPYLLFNGTIASPPGHPFWEHLIGYLRQSAGADDVLDATGPCILTSAQMSFADGAAFAVHPPSLFTPIDRDGNRCDDGDATLSVHHWAGTWWTPRPPLRFRHRLRKAFHKARYHLTRGAQFDGASARKRLEPLAGGSLPPADGNICILIPARDAEDHLAPLGEQLRALDYPAERIRLVFCEGDSADGTWERLNEVAAPLGRHFAGVELLRHHVGTVVPRKTRYRPELQRKRRASIARVRNHLIEHGLGAQDDWALWIDADVCHFPPDILKRLLAARERIVTPNCVTVSGGMSFDLNSFVERRLEKDHRYYKAVTGGLYQPDKRFFGRYYLSDLRHLDKVGLDAVGGTMLLVDAALHRGGLVFPEEPYADLIETEALGRLANDVGIRPVGLPRVEIRHVPW